MAPSRYRPIFGVSSIIIVVSLLYLLPRCISKAGTGTPFYPNLTASIGASCAVAILFAWIAFSTAMAVTAAFVSVSVILLCGLKTGITYYHAASILSISLITFLGYAHSRTRSKLDSANILRSEKLDEDINLLSNDTKQKVVLISSLEEKMLRYSLLKEVVESLSTALSLDAINELLMAKTLKTLGKEGRLLLFLVDQQKQELTLSASRDDLRVQTKKGDVFDHWVLRHRKSLIVEDVGTDFRFSDDDIKEHKDVFHSLISAPIVSENKIIGIIRVDNLKEWTYTQDDLRVLDIVADLAAVAIQNAFFYSKTQELARRDELTGLTVRRYFMERFREEVQRAARKRGELSFLMLDIDHFKDYNDRYGHAAGDLVLKYLAGTIGGLVREGDILTRYGGEEIGALLYGRNKREAAREAEKIRRAVMNKPFILRRQHMQLTVSIGVAAYPEDAASEEDLIRIADERLYDAKEKGRNRVCSG